MRRDIGVPVWLAIIGVADVEIHGLVENLTQQNASTEKSAYDVIHPITTYPRPDPCGKLGAPSS